MDHECRASTAIGLVIGIRIAEVKGEMILTVRIHLRLCHRVKAFRTLQVSLLLLRSKLAGSRTDRIHAKETELLARLHPHFKLFRGFKDTQEDRGAIVQSRVHIARTKEGSTRAITCCAWRLEGTS